MQRSVKRGPPKHLERILFINHKEDLMLDDRLCKLNLRSRQKIMELDLERIKVRNEWRNSRKKNVTLSEAIASGMLPAPEPVSVLPSVRFGGGANNVSNKAGTISRQSSVSDKRPVASAPARKRNSQQVSRAATFFREPGNGRESKVGSFTKHPVILEHEETEHKPKETHAVRRIIDTSMDTVGTYVLDEFEKVSQVVPDILRALAKKKEQYEEEKEQSRIAYDLKSNIKVDMLEYEPDMNKIRKTVSSVKKLRHRMAISKKLEVNKPKKSFDQMVKDRTENIGEHDEYTDGICVLMKRKLEKKRRDSSPAFCEKDSMGRRQSMPNPGASRRVSSLPEIGSRRASNFQALSRGTFGSSNKLGSLGQDSDTGTAVIDEDELRNRQKIIKEYGKYQMIQCKVEKFLVQRRPGSRALQRVLEEIAPV